MGTVSFGWASRIGTVAAGLPAVALLVGDLADASAPLGVPPTVWVIVSAALATITVLGRMWQAVNSGDDGSV